MKALKILLIGASGYVGSFVLKRLLHAGHDITATYCNNSRPKRNREEYWKKLDITAPINLKSIGRQYDAIIFLASSLSIDPVTTIKTDINGLQNLLSMELSSHFLFSSSIDVYGKGLRMSTSEHTTPDPFNWYGHGKICCERTIETWANKGNNRKFFILRIPFVLEAHQKFKGSYIGWILSTIFDRGRIVLSKYSYKRLDYDGFNWTSARIVSQIFTHATENKTLGCFNCVSYFTTWGEFFAITSEITGKNSVFECERKPGQGITLANHKGQLCDIKIRSAINIPDKNSNYQILSGLLYEICNYIST